MKDEQFNSQSTFGLVFECVFLMDRKENQHLTLCLLFYTTSGPLSVSQLAEIIDEKPVSVIKFLMTDLGVMVSMTQSLDPNTCIAVAEGFGKVVGGLDDEDYDE